MPTTPAIIARNQRILAGASAGATVRDLALAEAVDPAIVRRVLRAAGITPNPAGTPNPGRPALDAQILAPLADPAWLRAEYATKAAGQIARELGCPRERVYEALHAAGIPMRQNRYYPNVSRRVDAELADRIVARYVAGAGARQIAAELGVSAQRVRKIVAARGVKRTRREEAALRKAAPREHAARSRPAAVPSRWSPELEAVVLERYAAGESGEAIAAALGRSKRRVYRLLRERGVLRPPGRKRGTRDARQASAETAPEAPAPEAREILPVEVAEQVLARYAAGEAPRALAVALSVPASRIYRFLRERGVLRARSEARTLSCALQWAGVKRKKAEVVPAGRAGKEEWPAERVAEVLARYAAGEPGPAIAAELGLTRGRVYALLRQRGVVRTKSEAKRIGGAVGESSR